ncbi:hypothetical protein HKX48_007803 [Thoreauomyces humboldtii]|nr:hypothetical protein HKX48_007803 [Thoreauomyces humboldtii]
MLQPVPTSVAVESPPHQHGDPTSTASPKVTIPPPPPPASASASPSSSPPLRSDSIPFVHINQPPAPRRQASFPSRISSRLTPTRHALASLFVRSATTMELIPAVSRPDPPSPADGQEQLGQIPEGRQVSLERIPEGRREGDLRDRASGSSHRPGRKNSFPAVTFIKRVARMLRSSLTTRRPSSSSSPRSSAGSPGGSAANPRTPTSSTVASSVFRPPSARGSVNALSLGTSGGRGSGTWSPASTAKRRSKRDSSKRDSQRDSRGGSGITGGKRTSSYLLMDPSSAASSAANTLDRNPMDASLSLSGGGGGGGAPTGGPHFAAAVRRQSTQRKHSSLRRLSGVALDFWRSVGGSESSIGSGNGGTGVDPERNGSNGRRATEQDATDARNGFTEKRQGRFTVRHNISIRGLRKPKRTFTFVKETDATGSVADGPGPDQGMVAPAADSDGHGGVSTVASSFITTTTGTTRGGGDGDDEHDDDDEEDGTSRMSFSTFEETIATTTSISRFTSSTPSLPDAPKDTLRVLPLLALFSIPTPPSHSPVSSEGGRGGGTTCTTPEHYEDDEDPADASPPTTTAVETSGHVHPRTRSRSPSLTHEELTTSTVTSRSGRQFTVQKRVVSNVASQQSLKSDEPFGEEDDSTMDMEALSSHQHQMELDEENQRRMDYGYDTGAPNGRAESPMGFKRERGSEREQLSDADGAGDETILFRNSAGQEEERAEVITDMKIANAYLRQLKIIEAQERLLEGTSTNPEADRKRKRRRVREHVEKMKEDRRGKGQDDGDTRRGPPVFLKIRNPSASQLGPNTPGTARTKRMMAQTPSGSAPGGGEDYFGSSN